MKSSARPSSARSSASSSSTAACTETSSAEVISSQTSRSGFAASARAIATRWRSPPESSPGKRLASRARKAHPLEQRRDLGLRLRLRQAAQDAGRPRDRVGDAMAGVERVVRVLEDDLDPPARLARADPSPWRRAARRRAGSARRPGRAGRRCSGRSSSCRCPTRRRARRTAPGGARRRRRPRRRPRRSRAVDGPRAPRPRAAAPSSAPTARLDALGDLEGGVRRHSKQRTRRPPAISSSGGISSSQRATRCGQRGANAQPGGRSPTPTATPGMPRSRRGTT